MQHVRVNSWAELLDVLYADSWKEGLGRFRSDFAFRGLETPAEEMRTGLMRLGGDYGELERHLLRNFRKYAYKDAVPVDTVWNWLALAQHYGLPTRLLDWTFSPFVALHFATEHVGHFDEEGVVWAVDFIKIKKYLPARLRKPLKEEGANVFTAELLGRVAGDLEAYDRLAAEQFVAFFEPPSLDQRIINQFALFSLMSSPAASLLDWLKAHDGLSKRVVIPAKLKWEVRDKLDQANVSERVLYPGLDGLSRWLRRQYAPTDRSGKRPDDD
ncbi:MAG: FRG domain-containing protein [Gemmataceae bacterium]